MYLCKKHPIWVLYQILWNVRLRQGMKTFRSLPLCNTCKCFHLPHPIKLLFPQRLTALYFRNLTAWNSEWPFFQNSDTLVSVAFVMHQFFFRLANWKRLWGHQAMVTAFLRIKTKCTLVSTPAWWRISLPCPDTSFGMAISFFATHNLSLTPTAFSTVAQNAS